MFESCRAHSRVPRAGAEPRVVGYLRPDVSERNTVRGARDAADGLAVECELVACLHATPYVEHAQAPVDLAAVMLSRDGFLAGIAALAEADVRLVETGLGREDAVVELTTPQRDARLDPPALDVVLAGLVAGRTLVEPLAAAEHEPRLVLLRLDVDFRREARALQLSAHRVAELRLGEQQEVVGRTPVDAEGRDDPRLRRQEQRVAHVVCGDVVRDHPLQEVLRVRPRHAEVRTRAKRNAWHRN